MAPVTRSLFLFSRLLQDKEALIEAALDTASLIASKSPIAVQGTKISMVYAKDHTIEEGIQQIVCCCLTYHSVFFVGLIIVQSRNELIQLPEYYSLV